MDTAGVVKCKAKSAGARVIIRHALHGRRQYTAVHITNIMAQASVGSSVETIDAAVVAVSFRSLPPFPNAKATRAALKQPPKLECEFLGKAVQVDIRLTPR